MKILIVGNGGREHTLLWKLQHDAPDASFFITKGNGGTEGLAEHLPLDPGDTDGVATWAAQNQADLVVVGPEAPLAAGLVDALQARGVPAFGPTAAAARIEASKKFAKELMDRAGVPTAAFRSFNQLGPAARYIHEQGAPIVVKASGLAAGKGAIVCETEDAAVEAAREMLDEGAFGQAGAEIVVEECMTGEELSVFALTDGDHAVLLLPSQDHKRIGEGDVGPNTGGMGAYAPVSIADARLLQRVREHIIQPTLAALREEGAPFRGLLYAGLMLTHEGPKVVEFNCRFGDPETQAVLPLLRSSLLELMIPVANDGSIAGADAAWHDGAALTTVLASGGYPGSYQKGKAITIPDEVAHADDLVVFHAGTRKDDAGRLLTSGGRVLAVTATGTDMAAAAARSREGAGAIDFEGKQYRADIGWRELERHAGAA